MTFRVCAWCDEEISTIKTGEDWLDYCEGCHLVEGDTRELIQVGGENDSDK